MFDRQHHQRVAQVLEALDAEQLAGAHCLFGGGTAIALKHGEYRESVDIDFMVSNREGYRQLREALTGPVGIAGIVRPGQTLEQIRDIRADQYGVRTLLRVANADLEFEIVLEARIELEAPGADDRLCGVATLTPLDMATRKLLANADRWADDSVHSRDLIDLAMMAPPNALLRRAVAKARGAYGDSVERDLASAIQRLRERPQRLDDCMRALRMTTVPKAVLWSRIRALAPKQRSAGAPTPRA